MILNQPRARGAGEFGLGSSGARPFWGPPSRCQQLQRFIQTDFSLKNVGSVELEETADQRWLSTSIVFRSQRGREVIHRSERQGQFLSQAPNNKSEDLNVFRFWVGA